MSAVDLDALERLHHAAFCAPWTYSRWEIDCPQIGEGNECGYEHNLTRVESPTEYPDGQVVADIDIPGLERFAEANGELIVAMRNALPVIISELRAARAVVAVSRDVQADKYWSRLGDALRAYDEATK